MLNVTVLQALADPGRLQMVQQLVSAPLSVGELARPHHMSLPAVMQHLAVLERAGLVRTEKQGRVRTCHLQMEPLREVELWLGEQRQLWEHRLDRLGDFLQNTAEPIEMEGKSP